MDGNFARIVTEQVGVFSSGVHVLGSSRPLDRRQKVPADKVLVVSRYKVLFPAAISVSPDLAVL